MSQGLWYRQMVCAASTIVVLAAAFPLFCSSAGPLDAARSSYPSADDVRKIYEGVLQKNKAILKSVGRHIHGCLDDRALEMHGLLKPGERVNLIKRRALLYGPAINASSYSHVAMTFTRMMNTVCEYYKLYSPVPSTPMEAIAAASDFEESEQAASAPCEQGDPTCCAFDPSGYRTLEIHLDNYVARDSKCVITHGWSSPINAGMCLGVQNLFIVDHTADVVLYPHTLLRYMHYTLNPLNERALNVTLQIFGPCATPFSMEKQTLLRVALLEVLADKLRTYTAIVKQVKEQAGGTEGNMSGSSAVVTLVLGVVLDEHQPPFVECKFARDRRSAVTTSQEGEVPPLTQYLESAGLTVSKIQVLDVSSAADSPDDTFGGSLRWALKEVEIFEAKEAAHKRRWAVFLALCFGGAIAALLGEGSIARDAVGGYLRPPAQPCLGLRRRPHNPRRSSTFLPLFPTTPELPRWKCIISPTDLKFLFDDSGSKQLVGSGFTGDVYKGLYKDAIQVAIKEVNLQAPGDQQLEAIFKEADVLLGCRHPHILEFMGAVDASANGAVCLVTELMKGGDLEAALQGGDEFRWHKRGAQVAYDIASALVYLHSKKIVHLDVTCRNILLNENGEAKLGGMSISAKATDDKPLQAVVTTLTSQQSRVPPPEGFQEISPFIAPEVKVELRVSCSADIYSFGVVLWKIVTGRSARSGSCPEARVPEDCSQGVADFIQRCCAKDKGARPTAEEAMSFLEQHLDPA